MSDTATKGRQIKWYRSPVDPELLKRLSQRSDVGGFVQTLGYLGLYATTAALALYGAGVGTGGRRWPVPLIVLVVFLHGTVCAFMINGVHELGHGTVFRTRWLNAVFVRVL